MYSINSAKAVSAAVKRASMAAVLLAAGAASASPPSKVIVTHRLAPSQAREDLGRLRFSLEHAHAAPYRYVSKPELDRQLQGIAQRLNHPITDLGLYRLLAPVVAAIRNSHTSIQPPTDALRSMRTYDSVFPFVLRYRSGAALIEANLSDDPTVRPGMEVLGLDRRPMSDVTRDLMAMRPAEGFSETGKYARLNQSFWLDLMLRYGPSRRYAVRLRDASTGAESEHVVDGAPAEKVAAAVQQFPPSKGATLSMTIDAEDSVAMMRLRSFLDPTTPSFFARSFHELANSGVQNLILDLRGNHGGIDWFNSDLLSYLCDRPFRFYRDRTYVARSYDDLKYLKYSIDDFLLPDQIAALPAAIKENPFSGWTLARLMDFSLASDHAGGVQLPRVKDHFPGRFYLLVDGMSGSSSAEVPALMHHLGIGTMIGEEPNGSYQGEVAGVIATLTLPNSHLDVRIPLVAYQNDVMPEVRIGRGVEPTFVVPEKLEDSVAGIDTVMNFTRALIRARESSDRARSQGGSAKTQPLVR